MRKRLPSFGFIAVLLALSFAIHHVDPQQVDAAQQAQIEKACPQGTTVLPFTQTLNQTNQKLRDSFCVDPSGNVTVNAETLQQGGVSVGLPGGATTQVQFNNAGAFGGTSSFTYDGLQSVGLGNGAFAALTLNSSSSPSITGALRLPTSGGAAKNSIGWRNNANSGDLNLVPNTSDQITFNGTGLCTAAGTNCPASSGVTEATLTTTTIQSGGSAVCAAGATCAVYLLPNAHTLVRLLVNMTVAPVGCSTNASFGIRDLTSSTNLQSATPTALGVIDSGVISVSMTAGHQFAVGVTVTGVGCTTNASAIVSATYQ